MQATAQVIPFRFEAREIRTMLIDDQPWFCAADICAVLGYSNSRQAIQKNCRPEGVSVRDTPTRGGNQAMTFISEGSLYRLILKSRKEEAIRFEDWVCDEVLPGIRNQGRYEDEQGKMATLIGETIGTDGFHMLGALIKGKVCNLPAAVQGRARAKIWSQTHAAFGVRSAADIPASQLDSARNFIAAYNVLDGEYIGRDTATAEQRPRLTSTRQRLLVWLDRDGVERWKEVPTNASVLTNQEFIRAILVDGDMPLSTDEMFQVAQLAMGNLHNRSKVMAAQLKQGDLSPRNRL